MTQSETIINSPGELPVQDVVLNGGEVKPDSWYARYVLSVLLLVYIFNFIDRQILAILAEEIKADLGVSDAQLGFLYGTAFAVFYATFGIAFGRLADIWNRKKLISLGLGLWSAMTALSGLARGFVPLAACRFGVGVGEASASPAAFSILYDYFSPRVRTTVMAIYVSGISIGSGLGVVLGGLILEAWYGAFPDPSLAPFGLKGWQAAFMVVGLPGVVMAFWTSTLREPARGMSDGVASPPPHLHPFRETASVILGMLPIVNWSGLSRGTGGRRAVGINVTTGAAIFFIAAVLAHFTGDLLQWAALGIGAYAVFSWAQGLKARDPVIFGLIFGCRSLLCVIAGGGVTMFMGAAFGFWLIPFLQRNFAVSTSEVGIMIGLSGALLGLASKVIGGVLTDWLRVHSPRAKLFMWLGGTLVSLLSVLLYLNIDSLTLVYACIFVSMISGGIVFGPWISMVNDLMIPRGRATASAVAYMSHTMLGIALGPYVIGKLSDVFAGGGMDSGEALRLAMSWGLILTVLGITVMASALPVYAKEEANLLNRARKLGEKI